MTVILPKKSGPEGDPKPVPAFWALTASASAVALSLFLWTQYPAGKVIFGANAILYSCVLSYWVTSQRRKGHLRARVVEPDHGGGPLSIKAPSGPSGY